MNKKDNSNKIMWLASVIVFATAIVVSCVLIANKDKQFEASLQRAYEKAERQAAQKCAVSGCDNLHITGSGYRYCYEHNCKSLGCRNRAVSGSEYCSEHQPSLYNTNNTEQKTTAAQNNYANKDSDDDYNIKDYNDVDDFYEDYYYDFEDFDEAEQYWDENHSDK